MDNKTLLERVVEEKQHCILELGKASQNADKNKILFYEGKICGFQAVERLLTEGES